MLDGVNRQTKDENGYHLHQANLRQEEEMPKKKEQFFGPEIKPDQKKKPGAGEPKPKKKGRCCLWIALTIFILLLAGGGYIYFRFKSFEGRVIQKNESGGAPFFSGSQVSGIATNGEGAAQIDKDRINILLLGIGGEGHSGGGLTDVIQVLSFNTKTKKALMISVPRDLYVNIENYGMGKINEMFQAGERNGGKGGPVSKKQVSDVLGIDVHYFLRIDFEGFVKVVNELGGIDVTVDKTINDPSQQTYIVAGFHHFDGAEALKYVRSRHTTSDFDRSSRQQKTLLAIKEKAVSLNILASPIKISNLLNIVSDHLTTDIQLNEAKAMAKLFKDLNNENVTDFVIDNNQKSNLLYSTSNKGGQYILLPVGGNFDKIHQTVEEMLP